MLLRLGYLAVSNAFAVLRLLSVGDRDKDVEILALGHQIAVLERQPGQQRAHFTTADRALLAALLHRLPLRRLRLLVRPDTVLRSPGPAGSPPRGQVTPEAPGPAAHRPLHPPAGPAPGAGEPLLGLPPHPW